MRIASVIDDGMSNTTTVFVTHLRKEVSASVTRGTVAVKLVAARRMDSNDRMLPVRDHLRDDDIQSLSKAIHNHLLSNNYFDLEITEVRSNAELASNIHAVEADRSNCEMHAVELRDVLLEILNARQELALHPTNDTTSVWKEKMARVERAEDAAKALIKKVATIEGSDDAE